MVFLPCWPERHAPLSTPQFQAEAHEPSLEVGEGRARVVRLKAEQRAQLYAPSVLPRPAIVHKLRRLLARANRREVASSPAHRRSTSRSCMQTHYQPLGPFI